MTLKLTDTLTFGKHKSEIIKDVIDDNPTYIEWCLDEIDWFKLDDKAFNYATKAIETYYWEDDYFDNSFGPGHPSDYGDK